jgi:hydroxymethylpyrimidine/phosphomethylpyrimidine kinase
VLAGIDPCGGAGLYADLRVVEALGGEPLGVPTCATRQNRHGFVAAWPTTIESFAGMLEGALGDGSVDAVKIGLVTDGDVAAAIVDVLDDPRLASRPVVLDPVLGATAGGDETAFRVEVVGRLLTKADAVTPNLVELERLGGIAGVQEAAGRPLAIHVKGGHAPRRGPSSRELFDFLVTPSGDAVELARHPRLPVGRVHGTGCAFASALAVGYARGSDDEAAGRAASAFVQERLRALAASGPRDDGSPPVPLPLP